MNAKDSLRSIRKERQDEGIWGELVRIVNPSATLTSDQYDFIKSTVITMCAESRRTKSGITPETIWSLATFINSCR